MSSKFCGVGGTLPLGHPGQGVAREGFGAPNVVPVRHGQSPNRQGSVDTQALTRHLRRKVGKKP